MEYRGKKVLVCGLAASGVAAAKLLVGLGAEVTLQDIKKEDSLEQKVLQSLKEVGVTLYLGENPTDIISSQELLVLSPGIPTDLPFIQKAREEGIPVIGEFELGSQFCPCPIAAITGTNGKTTTTALLGEIVRTVYPKAAVVGNIGIPFTEKVLAMDKEGYCVAEVSSFQLETIQSFHPHVAAVLNITPDHLDRHGTFEAYANMKKRIFENQNNDDILILNYDDPFCRRFHREAKSRVYYFSMEEKTPGGAWMKDGAIILHTIDGDKKLIHTDELQILGGHNYENAMAAVLMAYYIGVPIENIITGLKAFKAVPHRIEYVTTVNGIGFYNDSKGTNPDAAIKSIEAMKRPIVLIGGGYDKNSDYTKWVRTFPGKVKKLILMGETAEKIMACCHKEGFMAIERVNSLEEAVNTAFHTADPGDVVLLSPACASWDMFDDYEQRGDQFKAMALNLSALKE